MPPLPRPDGSTGVPSYEVQRRMLPEVQVWEDYHCKCGNWEDSKARVGSILENSHVTYEEFIKILAYFAEGKSVTSAAQHGNLALRTQFGDFTTRYTSG